MKVNKKVYFLLKEQVETEWKTENCAAVFVLCVTRLHEPNLRSLRLSC